VAAHGYVDGVRAGRLLGWAHDAQRPGERLALEVILDGRSIGRCVADETREDLIRAGIGDGRHGFTLPLPQPLVRGMTYELTVRAVRDGSLIRLAPDSFAEAPGDPDLPDPRLLDAGREPAPDGIRDQAPRAGMTARRPERELIRGRDGWCFAAPPARLERALGRRPAGPGEVEAALGILAGRHADLRARGIDHLVVAVPDKAAVYPDRLPAGYELDAEQRPAARLSARMRAEPRLELLDLWPVLRDARARGRVCHRRADGLTWTGAFHAYRAVAKELAKRRRLSEPLAVDWLVLGDVVQVGGGGELGDVVQVADGGELEAGFDLERLRARPTADGGEAALILHTGCAERIAPFLGAHFSPLVTDATGLLPADLVERVRPAVVVEFLADGSPLL
jgi:hypothetical protein